MDVRKREEILEQVSHAIHGIEVMRPFEVAKLMADNHIVPADKVDEVAGTILATPTLPFLYTGTRLFLEKILLGGSDVVLWTEGDPPLQEAKCNSSRLMELDDEGQGHIEISASENKVQALEKLLTKDRLDGKKRLILIDDKSTKLFDAYMLLNKAQMVDKKMLPDEIMYIWVRKDPKTKDKFPAGFPTIDQLNDFIKNGNVTEATSIDELPVLAHSLYFVDFDRTVFDTDAWFSTVKKRIVGDFASG